jgi:hypothetical protein
MMKKVLYLLLFMVVVLAGCGKVNVDPLTLHEYFQNTEETYADSNSGRVSVSIVDNEGNFEFDYIYLNNETTIEEMQLLLTEGNSVIKAYVKNKNAYINVDGQKTYAPLASEAGKDILAGYWFSDLTSPLYKMFDKSIFNALKTDESKKGEAKLTWDKDDYTFMDDNYTPDEFYEADIRFTDVKENIKSITVSIKYANELITSLESTWTNNDNEVTTITINFHGTDEHEISFPADLNSYTER